MEDRDEFLGGCARPVRPLYERLIEDAERSKCAVRYGEGTATLMLPWDDEDTVCVLRHAKKSQGDVILFSLEGMEARSSAEVADRFAEKVRGVQGLTVDGDVWLAVRDPGAAPDKAQAALARLVTGACKG